MKDDYLYLVNNAKHIFLDRPLEKMIDDTKINEKLRLSINRNMNKLSVDVRNCALSLKQWLVGTLQSFQKNTMIMSGLSMEKLSMLMLMMQFMMFRMTITLSKFRAQNTVNIKTACLLILV